MKKVIFLSVFMLLTQGSYASLMKLSYEDFNAPVSPTNYPVDRSGVVSFEFDAACMDVDLDPNHGAFYDPIKAGFLFLGGVTYDIDVAYPTSFTTTFSDPINGEVTGSLRVNGTINNVELGRTWTFSLALFGTRIHDPLGNDNIMNLLNFNIWDRHLLIFDDSAVLFNSYEGGFADIVPVPEPSSFILMVAGLFGLLVARLQKPTSKI